MLKFLLAMIARLNDPADGGRNAADLLQHPALESMSERELADLPLSPARPGRAPCAA